jgi:phospholipid-translocating ATPase/phospholipid-transporting ATPase
MDSLFNYQGPSPDEIALVDAAQRLGFKYCGLKDGIIQIEEQTSNKIH